MSRRPDEPLLQVPASMPPPEPRPGDLYFEQGSGEMLMFDGTDWVKAGQASSGELRQFQDAALVDWLRELTGWVPRLGWWWKQDGLGAERPDLVELAGADGEILGSIRWDGPSSIPWRCCVDVFTAHRPGLDGARVAVLSRAILLRWVN